MPDVVCLGQFTADVVVTAVDSLPEQGRAISVDDISLHSGGCACNTAVALGKLGIPTAVIGKVGCDAFGDFLINTMTDAGLDTSAMARDPSVSTSATAVLIHSDGERSFLHYGGGNAEFTEVDVDHELIGRTKILHVAAAFLVGGLDGRPMARVLARAREMGVTTCLDTAWDAQGRWQLIEPCLEHVDVFFANLEEAQMITGEQGPREAAQCLLDRGMKAAVIKLGAEGCYTKTAAEAFRTPAFPVENVVDTLGAGDAFVAGYLAGMVRQWDIRRSCRLANAVAACCVGARGPSGVKSLDETMGLYDV